MTESTASLQRPQNVTLAVRILWFFLVVNVIVTIAMYLSNWDALVAEVAAKQAANTDLTEEQMATAKTIGTVSLVAIPIIATVLCALFYTMIGKGKNWARILLLVLSVLGIGWLAYSYWAQGGPSFETGWEKIYNGSVIVGSLATLASLVLLFSPNANPWFKPRSH